MNKNYLPSDSDILNGKPDHHNAPLHLRHLMSHSLRHQTQHKVTGVAGHESSGDNIITRPTKNVSFADVENILSKCSAYKISKSIISKDSHFELHHVYNGNVINNYHYRYNIISQLIL